MPCERCGKQNPADVHTCTPCREYMLEIIQKEISDGGSVFLGDLIDWFNLHEGYFCKQCGWVKNTRYDSEEMVERCMNKHGEYGKSIVIHTDIDMLEIRQEKRKPIQDQDDECIRYIYSLLPPEVRK